MYAFSVGIGLILASLQVFFRDIQFIYGVFTMIWMYLTPLFYSVDNVSSIHRIVISFNPMYYYINQFRDLTIYGRLFDPNHLLYGGAAALFFLALGTFIFKKLQDKYILYI